MILKLIQYPARLTYKIFLTYRSLNMQVNLSKYYLSGLLRQQFLTRAKQRAVLKQDQEMTYAKLVTKDWDMLSVPASIPEKIWTSKNPDLRIPVAEDVPMTDEQWIASGFPHHPIPPNITTHVNVSLWRQKTQDIARDGRAAEAALMSLVLDQLTNGVNSEVQSPGDSVTKAGNFFQDPAVDIPRIADALCSEVRCGHMSGPLPLYSVNRGKINGLISVKKPDGGRRQIGNMSAPRYSSFNDGIQPSTLQSWRVVQTTAKQFAAMIARAGNKSIISCSDMVAAYKCLPVCMSQRRLQCFHFLGKEFLDLRLIFGDRSACMHYDRFHFCVLLCFVLPRAPFPLCWMGRTVDDLTTVSPKNAAHLTFRLVKEYRKQLTALGIGVAPVDPSRRKAFDGNTSGEILGVWFNTEEMTWNLPQRKLVGLVTCLVEATIPSAKLSLHQVEVLHGKLNHFSTLAAPLKMLVAETLAFLKDLLEKYNASGEAGSRSKEVYSVPASMKHDLKTVACIVAHTEKCPLPILEPVRDPPLTAVHVYTDFSGHLLASPSLGVYSPSQEGEAPLVASLAFPRFYLNCVDQAGHKAYAKSTANEGLGLLVTLLLDPMRFVERAVVFTNDNVATVLCFQKGYSKGDQWATTLIRAARVVAAGIGCEMFAVWEPRRSSRPTRVADDLTHNLLHELTEEEVKSYLARATVSFPPPVMSWMTSPKTDQGLGHRSLLWLRETCPMLRSFRPQM